MPANNRVGIVLAGGASRRMQAAGMTGVTGMTGMNAWSDKATLTLAGQTFVERVCLAVATEVAEVIVVAAPLQELPSLPSGVIVVRDSLPGAGPLAGIADGMGCVLEARRRAGQTPPEVAVIVSCDVPLLRPAVVRLLCEALGCAEGARAGQQTSPKAHSARDTPLWVVPVVGGYRQVLVSALRPELLATIQAYLGSGRCDPRGLLEQIHAADPGAVRFLCEPEIAAVDPDGDSFCDVDTWADFHRINSRLQKNDG